MNAEAEFEDILESKDNMLDVAREALSNIRSIETATHDSWIRIILSKVSCLKHAETFPEFIAFIGTDRIPKFQDDYMHLFGEINKVRTDCGYEHSSAEEIPEDVRENIYHLVERIYEHYLVR